MTSLNNTINLPLSQRPKLYKQMLDYPYDLIPFDSKTLFNYLQAEKKYVKITFRYYSEFLNVFNTLIFFYILCYNISKTKSIDIIIFIGTDSIFMVTALGYYFLIKNKSSKQNSSLILVFGIIGVICSKAVNFLSHRPSHNLNMIHLYIKLNYVIFSVTFLMCYDYYINPGNPSSTVSKVVYIGLGFIMSNLVGTVEAKIRMFLYAINFFEFIPEIRKLTSNYSNRMNFICYLVTVFWVETLMLYMGKYVYCLRLFVGNVCFIVFYPMIFDYFYKKHKKLIKGLWDLPNVISYY